MKALFEIMKHLPHAKIFLTMVWTAGFAELFMAASKRTIFLPTDEAFQKLSPNGFKELMRDKAKLAIVLAYHIIPERLKLSELIYKTKLQTLFGMELPIYISDEVEIKIDDAYVTRADLECKNGIIHEIDSVLIPKLDKASAEKLLAQLNFHIKPA